LSTFESFSGLVDGAGKTRTLGRQMRNSDVMSYRHESKLTTSMAAERLASGVVLDDIFF